MTEAELHKEAVDTLLENNVGLFRWQRGVDQKSKQLQSAGRAADSLLGSSSKKVAQLQEFTAAVLSKVGIKARNATPDAMREVKDNVRAEYEAAHKDAHVRTDGEFVKDLSDIQAKARRTPKIENAFDAQIEHIRRNVTPDPSDPKAPPRMTAEAANEIRIELGQLAGSADPLVRGIANDLMDAIDAATERSLPPAQAAALKTARGKFHFMKQIEDAIETGKAGVWISPSKLFNVINRKRNKNEAVYGGGDQSLAKLARAGKQVIPEDVGNSGSPSRGIDVGKIFTAIQDPVLLAKVTAATVGGRAMNEAGRLKGTPNYTAAQAEKAARGSSPAVAVLRQGVAQSSKETEEEKKRKAQAAALRNK
jgi:hypothetical protein